MSIQYIAKEGGAVYVIGLRHEGAEFKEDVCSHCIDPEDEGRKCVKADVTNSQASNGASKKNSSVVLYDIAESKADVGCKIVEYKSNGDLAEKRTMKIRV